MIEYFINSLATDIVLLLIFGIAIGFVAGFIAGRIGREDKK